MLNNFLLHNSIRYTYLFNEVHTLGGLHSIRIVDDVWNVVTFTHLANFNNSMAEYKKHTTI